MHTMNILIVDDEEIIRNEIKEYFEKKKNYKIFTASKSSECYMIMENNNIDIIILDINIPEENGIEVLKKVRDKYPDTEVIMITGQGDNKTIKTAMKLGAFDFFYKPIGLIEIEQSIERTNRYLQIKEKLNKIEKKYNIISDSIKMTEINIIGNSEEIKNIISLTSKAANSRDTSVLITGPSGSGKELIAKILHYQSDRKYEIFFPVNCSAIPNNLIESEFFGYKKGAFTGANEDKLGFFEMANNGTLFLDEIGDLNLSEQSKLLRVLEERTIRKIGGSRDIPVDIRIVSATNNNLYEMVKNKAFREDLFYRLNTIEINIPPLEERKSDIPLLIKHFTDYYAIKILKKKIKISQDVFDYLMKYNFPGNIRELKNIIERAVILCDKDTINLKHISLPCLINNNKAKKNEIDFELPTYELDKLEKIAISKALIKCKYNQKNAAKLLNISIYALSRKITKYSIEVK